MAFELFEASNLLNRLREILKKDSISKKKAYDTILDRTLTDTIVTIRNEINSVSATIPPPITPPTSGNGGVIDLGDRTIGNEVVDLGNRT